ncbi:hypothetical protein ACH4U3_34565 [Streptomyces griseoruber]|uniref:hypothetical protein n=1 Tax=Streptomyces griseoruber TaxID=1943 RepID=UPI0037A9AEFC
MRGRLVMVKNRHDASRRILEISFAVPAGSPAGVEVRPLADLGGHRAPDERLTAPRRPDLHHLSTLTGGTLWHTVDFPAYAVEPGSWPWARPSQVQQRGDLIHAERTLVLFHRTPSTRPPPTAGARVEDP